MKSNQDLDKKLSLRMDRSERRNSKTWTKIQKGNWDSETITQVLEMKELSDLKKKNTGKHHTKSKKHGPAAARGYDDVWGSCYHRRPCGHPRPGAMLVSKGHTAAGPLLSSMACTATWGIQTGCCQGPCLCLWFYMAGGLCWSPKPVLQPKIIGKPRVGATTCGLC